MSYSQLDATRLVGSCTTRFCAIIFNYHLLGGEWCKGFWVILVSENFLERKQNRVVAAEIWPPSILPLQLFRRRSTREIKQNPTVMKHWPGQDQKKVQMNDAITACAKTKSGKSLCRTNYASTIKCFYWLCYSRRRRRVCLDSLLRLLHRYILKMLISSISVNSGIWNIYLAASQLGKYFVVKYTWSTWILTAWS